MDPKAKDSVSFFLFEAIENMKELKELLLKGELTAAMVNTDLVYHVDQLLQAAHKCLYNNSNYQLKTKSIFTEFLYCLYPSKSIRDALKTIGAQDTSSSAIFVTFNYENEMDLDGLRSHVKGSLVPLDRITELRNVTSIKKLYKIPQDITDENTILDCILTKLASKELIV